MARVENPSRLSESSEQLRSELQTRNLYTDFKEYPPEPDQTEKIVNSISAVVEAVQPFKSVDLKDSAFARLITLPNTPLTDIGLIMLGKQFGLNFSSNLAQQTFPKFKPLNILSKNNPIFEKNVNYNITNNAQVSGATNIQAYLQRFLSFTKSENPLPVNVTNSELMERTGKGQLELLFGDGKTGGGINMNIYKPGGAEYFRAATISKMDIEDRSAIINEDNKIFYNFIDDKFNPYLRFSVNPQSQNRGNKVMINAYNLAVFGSNSEIQSQEYMPKQENVDTYLGQTDVRRKGDFLDSDIPEFSNFHLDNDNGLGLDQKTDDQVVWGKSGVDTETNERLRVLRGLNEDDEFYDINENRDVDLKFNGKSGLLAYTRNLLNATEGKVVDQTRKVFLDGSGNLEGFNGSGLWKSNNSRYAQESGFNDKKGLRQHSPLDQYDRFAKAIRFKGNSGYNKDGNNEDSVLYESVLPRIHPTVNEETGALENKNLTFSIENLAVQVVGDNKQAFINDDSGTEIPYCEKGPFGGRMLWFPPYGLELNETANAKYDPTVMVGRGEPIYTYIHSERSANLSFLMMMDYPPQVKNYRGRTNKEIAEFFTFGGDNYETPSKIKDVEKLEQELIIKKKELEDFGKESYPDKTPPPKIRISFPNDKPTDGEINSIINDMYNEYHYEINPQIESSDGTTFGINASIYNASGTSSLESENPDELYDGPVPYIDQYSVPYVRGERELDDSIYNLFNKEEERKFFKIVIEAGASKLFNGPNEQEYNEELGRRRVEATQFFIESRIKAIFGPSALKGENRIRIEFGVPDGSTGSEKADPKNDTEEAIPKEETKRERYALVQFENTDVTPSTTRRDLTPEEEQRKIQLEVSVRTLKNKIAELKKIQFADCTYEQRKSNNLSNQDDGILHSYQAIIDGKFYPAFHSQTPEDFHKRLTFLHQCTRQGPSIKQKMSKDGNNIKRAKNSVFGRQPICILRVGDFLYTKVVIETITIDYVDATWDLNPEGWGMQPMLAKVNVQMKVIGGQSLKGPIDALQNAVSFNYYANSSYSNKGIYILPSYVAAAQDAYNQGVSYTDFQNSEIAEDFESKRSANLKTVSEIIREEKEKSEQE